jgi:hypothetical protein
MYNAVTAYEDTCFKADVDFHEGLPFFHVEVKRELGKEDIKFARAAFKEIKSSLLNMGYDRLFAYTPSRHFARLVGGGFVDIPVEGGDENMQLIVWELLEV